MWDFEADMLRWNAIASEAHSRHSREDVSTYVRSQTIVETIAHRKIGDVAESAARVLEIGIGGGEHLAFGSASPANRDYYVGVDLDEGFAKICREKFDIQVVCADAALLPFHDASFDCVIAMSVLEHIQPLDQTLAEISRVLEPLGALHVAIPTNGSFVINAFKRAMTYPTMRRAGIKRPDLLWHYLNVNSFKRIRAALDRHFVVRREEAVPLRFLPWQLSPLWMFTCSNRSV